MKRIYLKTEPCGEYNFHRLSEKEINGIKRTYNTDAIKNLDLYLFSCEMDNLGRVQGVALSESVFDDSEGRSANFIEEESIGLSSMEKISEDVYADGVFAVLSKPTKMSMSVDLLVDEKDYNASKMTVKYRLVDLFFIKDSYGKIQYDLITEVGYNGKDYTHDMIENFVDRGYAEEVTIFQIYNDNFSEIVKWRGSEVNWLEPVQGN